MLVAQREVALCKKVPRVMRGVMTTAFVHRSYPKIKFQYIFGQIYINLCLDIEQIQLSQASTEVTEPRKK